MRVNPIYRLRVISDVCFLVGPGTAYEINDTGVAIWKGISDGVSIDDISRQISEEFEISSKNEISLDVNDFITFLRDNELVLV